MQDDSLNGRDYWVDELRAMAKENEQSMRGGMFSGNRAFTRDRREFGTIETKQSTFLLRILLSLAIFGGFLWTHLEGSPLPGVNTEKVVEAVSTNVRLQDFVVSDNMKP